MFDFKTQKPPQFGFFRDREEQTGYLTVSEFFLEKGENNTLTILDDPAGNEIVSMIRHFVGLEPNDDIYILILL